MQKQIFIALLLCLIFFQAHNAHACFKGYDRGTSYPLHAACESNKLKEVKRLVEEEKYDVNALDIVTTSAYAMTPLHCAAGSWASRDLIFYLLDHGADPNSVALGYNKNTPMHLLALYNGEMVPEIVEKYGGDINARNINGDTPFHFAAYHGQIELLQYCLDSGAEFCQNKLGQNPFHMAIAVDMSRPANHNTIMFLSRHFEVDRRALGLAWKNIRRDDLPIGWNIIYVWTWLRLTMKAYPAFWLLLIVILTSLFALWIRWMIRKAGSPSREVEEPTGAAVGA